MSSQPAGADHVYVGHSQSVVAEEAPLGVLLWPVISPEFAPNFTLESVSVVRTEVRTTVVWTYQNGSTRHFEPGTLVSVKMS